MNAKRLFHVSLPVLLLWLVSLPVHAAVEAGRILFARGTVSIVDASDAARGAGTGSVFHEGDRVVTGNNSIVQLRLSDGALTALRSNSDYQIQRQRFDEEADVYEQAGRLLSGWMRSVTGAIGARYPGNVSQGTSVATIGIRGTTYQIIHVPEEGLAEFPNLQPGTYVYLEEGQVEVSNAAGSRIVSPGQVVRVPGPDAAPELAPELTELFQSEVLQGAGSGDSDGVTVRDLLADASSEIVDSNGGSPAPPLGEGVFALMTCSMCMSQGGLLELQSEGEASNISGTGQDRFLSTADVYMGTIQTALPGKTPVDSGYYAFYEDGELVSQAHWGRWRESDYTINNEPASGSWQYIFADNVNVNYEVGLAGNFRYDLADSSIFRGSDAGGNAISTRLEGSSYVDVFFGDLSAGVNLSFSNGDTLTGFGGLGALYSEGLYLSGGDNEALYGSMVGALLGSDGIGLMSMISYYNEQNANFYEGSAVFERGDEVQLPAIAGVSAFGVDTGSFPNLDRKGVLDFGSVQTGITDGYFFPSVAEVVVDGATYELAGNAPIPSSFVQAYFVVNENEDLATAVYWGVWDDYAINQLVEPSPVAETAAGDWHFMVATNVLPESAIAAIGLTGEAVYDYRDGTPLRDVNGLGSDLSLGFGSNVVVDFGQLATSNGIQVNLDISGSLLEGSGSLEDLYSSAGILLAEVELGMGAGSLSGAFAGSQAEALLGAVNYTFNTENYVGTALFEKNPPQVVAP